MIDLIGQRFGRLTVLEMSETHITPKGRNVYMWKCLCDCGNLTVVSTSSLRNGNTKSCGCFQKEMAHKTNSENLAGKRFGRLVAVDEVHKNGLLYCNCVCDCGNITEVLPSHLKRGLIRSCGCLRSETSKKMMKKHGMKNTRIYKIWIEMRARCTNENYDSYKDYGGRGISVCPEWKNSFENFRDWAFNNGYSDVLTLDRIDVNGNYEPTNCRWATYEEQANNKRTNKIIEYKGEKKTLAEWAREVGINYVTLHRRICVYGWDIEKAIETPVRHKK